MSSSLPKNRSRVTLIKSGLMCASRRMPNFNMAARIFSQHIFCAPSFLSVAGFFLYLIIYRLRALLRDARNISLIESGKDAASALTTLTPCLELASLNITTPSIFAADAAIINFPRNAIRYGAIKECIFRQELREMDFD